MKGYSKSQKLHYETIRRHRLKAKIFKGKPSRGRSTYAQFYTPEQRASAVGANIADLTQFLAKYLSGKQNVYVVPQGRGFATSWQRDRQNRPFYDVYVPPWDKYNLPLKGFDKYRIYRSGVWHESCHVKHTPPNLFAWGSGIERDVFNVIEDRRIEELGVKDWPGYLPERIYTQAYAYAIRPKVDTIIDKARRVYEAFIQKLLIGKIKGKLAKEEEEKVAKAVKYVEEKLEKVNKIEDMDKMEEELRKAVRDVMEILELPSNTPYSDYGTNSSWEATFTDNYATDQGVSQEDLEKGMDEFFDEAEKKAKAKPSGKDKEKTEPSEITKEDVQTAREGSVEVKNEYDQAQKGKVEDPLTKPFAPVLTQGPAQNFRDNKFITDMNTHLRKWKTGYEVIIGKTGARLSIPDYIRHQEEPFATRLKRSAKGKKMLVIADFSGSMNPQQDEYKKAIISALDVLSGIGSNIALFGFGSDPAQGDIFFKVKTFEEPRWTNTHASKVAALEANYGNTPTHKIYQNLEGYIKKHKPDITVTITDGGPDDPLETSRAIDTLRKHTHMVAFGIGGDRQHAEWMAKKLKDFGYHDSFAVADLREIPPKLVKLLAPE